MSEEINLLKQFIYNDEVQDVLSKINDNVMDFNILEITGMGTQEIKHSNILAWLFDDLEHNLEYQILDGFLKKVIQVNKCDGLQSYLYLSSVKKVITIYREKDNIDLLIVDEANNVVIAIENKIYASESETQLSDYQKVINKNYKDYDKYFIFLTIDSEEPSDGNENWIIAKHEMVTTVIEETLKSRDITIKTKIILESYVDLLKRNGIVSDVNLEELCNKIWSNKDYANAIDILMEYRVSPINSVYYLVKEKLAFYEDSSTLELDSIKRLYTLFEKDWESSQESIFEITCAYNGEKNEHIWLGFVHPDLGSQDSSVQNTCQRILTKVTKKYETILKIDKKYLEKKDVEMAAADILEHIQRVDLKIKDVLMEEE